MTWPPTVDTTRWYTSQGTPCRPHPRQQWAQRAALHPDVRELALIGGFGSGKTLAAANILLRIMVRNAVGGRGQQARYFICSSSVTQVRTVTLAAFVGVFNAASGWSGRWRDNPVVLAIDHMHKVAHTAIGMLQWGSGHDGAQWAEGQEFVAGIQDEAPLHLPVTQRRLRERLRQTGYPWRCLVSVFTPQPGRSLAWLYERYHLLEDGIPRDGVVKAAMPTAMNAANLPPGYVEQLRAMYSASMAEALLAGKLVLLTGRSVPDWGDASIVEYELDPARPTELWWDPGYHRPGIVAVQEVQEGSGRWCIVDQVQAYDVSTEQQAVEIAGRPWARGLVRVIHDPAALSVQAAAAGGASDHAVLRRVLGELGVRPRFLCGRHPEDRSIEVGMERLRAMVCSADGTRRLLISRKVVAAERKHLLDTSGKPVVGVWRALSEQPLDDRTGVPDRRGDWDHWSHAVDVCRYGAVYHSVLQRIDRTAWTQAAPAAEAESPPRLRVRGRAF